MFLNYLTKQAEEEANQLRNILVAREAEMEQMKNEISILSRPGLSHVDTSTIEILKAQIQVCTEDFEKERQDRQVALRQVDSLKDKLSKLQRDVSLYFMSDNLCVHSCCIVSVFDSLNNKSN